MSRPVARSAAMRANKAKVPHCIKRASFSLLRFIPEKNTWLPSSGGMGKILKINNPRLIVAVFVQRQSDDDSRQGIQRIDDVEMHKKNCIALLYR